MGLVRPNVSHIYLTDPSQRLRCHTLSLLSFSRIAPADGVVAAVAEQQGAVQYAVIGFGIYVLHLIHHPILVPTKKQIRAGLVEEVAFDALAPQGAPTELR